MKDFRKNFGNAKTLLDIIQKYQHFYTFNFSNKSSQTMFDISCQSTYSTISDKQALYFKTLLLGKLEDENDKNFVRSLPVGDVKIAPVFENTVYYLGKGVWLCRVNYEDTTVRILKNHDAYYSKDTGYNIFRENKIILDHLKNNHNKPVKFTHPATERYNLVTYLLDTSPSFVELQKTDDGFKVSSFASESSYLEMGGYIQEWLFDENEILSVLYSISVTRYTFVNVTIDPVTKKELSCLLSSWDKTQMNKKLLKFYGNPQPTSFKHILSMIEPLIKEEPN